MIKIPLDGTFFSENRLEMLLIVIAMRLHKVLRLESSDAFLHDKSPR